MSLIRVLRRHTIFSSLHHRDYRWFWLGRVLSSGTMQMGGVAQGWLVYHLTGSGFALGWVSAGWSSSTLLLSLFGGTISDRVEKRDLLIYMRLGQLLNTLVLTVLIMTDLVQVWHMAVSSLITGVFFSFMMPAQNALVSELVNRETLLNAISLNSIGMGLMGIVAAWLAGWAIDSLGVGSVYIVMALSYAGIIFTLFQLPRTQGATSRQDSVWKELKAGVGYLRICPIVIPLLALVFARGLFAMPYRTMMPKFAKDVMGMGASGLGWLTAASGAGSLIASLALASLGDYRGKGKLLLLSGIVMGLAILAFANTLSLPWVLLLLALVGGTGTSCMVTNQTLLQLSCDDEYRGRVMSMYMMMFGVTQLSNMPVGALADSMGVQWVLTLEGGLFAATFVAILLFARRIRRLE